MTTTPTDDASVETSPDPDEIDPDAPVLALPTELVVDEAARLRLERQLAAAPEDVVGVVAARGDIPPGSSARTRAERAATAAMSEVSETADRVIDGAVLLRPGTGFELSATSVQIDGGRLLVDRGAIAHDPWTPQATLEVAVAEGRPPFQWRPVVLLLGLEPDLDLAETARGLANGLLARDVEARLAAPEVPEGFYLTRPCRPVVESVQALEPDVIVALDPTALGVASPWSGTSRSTTVVELTQDITYGVRLVSWRIGVAQGRLRARVGRGVASADLAQLVNRLCSGPQPLPPTRTAPAHHRDLLGIERAVAIAHRRTGGGARASGGTVVAIGPPADRPAPDHLQSVLQELGSAGYAVHRSAIEAVDPAVIEAAPLVLVSSSAGPEALREVAERRANRRRPTVLDVEPEDAIVPADADADGRPEVRPDIDAMCVTGFALTTSLGLAEQIRRHSTRAQVVPYLTQRAHIDELEQAADDRPEADGPIVAWRVGTPGPAPAPVAAALVGLLDSLLGDGVRVELLTAEDRVPEPLAGRAGVTVRSHEPAPAEMAAWTAQMWTPPTGWAELSGDLRCVVEAGFAGVPTLIGGSDRYAVAGLADLDLVVEEVDNEAAWAGALQSLFDDGVRARRGARARAASLAIHGPDASRLRIARLMGWLGLIGPP